MNKYLFSLYILALVACGSPAHKNVRGQHKNTVALPVPPPLPSSTQPATLVRASPESLIECRAPEGQDYWFDCRLIVDQIVLARGDQNTVRFHKVRSRFDCPMGDDRTANLVPLSVTLSTAGAESARGLFSNRDEEFEISGSGDLIVRATDAARLRKHIVGKGCSLIITASSD